MTERPSTPYQLSPDRVQEILDASQHTDVPAGRLLGTAETIQSTLLHDGARNPHVIPYDRHRTRVGVAPTMSPAPVRHRGRAAVLVSVVAATTVLAMAGAGALPGSVQSRVARGASVLGIHLPNADDDVADSQDPGSPGSNGTANRDKASNSSGDKSGSKAGANGAPVKAADGSSTATVDTENGDPNDTQPNAGGKAENPGKRLGTSNGTETSNSSNGSENGNGNSNGNGNGNPNGKSNSGTTP